MSRVADDEIIQEIVEQVGSSTKKWGFSPIIGEAWMLLYFKGEKTQDDIKNDLGCSLSSVSQALSVLESFGMVHVSDKKGRKKVYRAEESFSKIKRKKMEVVMRFYINPMTDLLSSRIDDVSDKKTKAKVKELKNMYSKVGMMIKLMLKVPFGK